MKNIHILPTDKPSRLFKVSGELKLTRNFDFYNGSEYQNIYITSNEEIKDGDWFLTDDKRVEKCAPDWRAREWHKKIILTTDQDLIKDGVQAIDDEFLEFIVKNPSCEEVKVEEFEPIYGHQNNSNSVLYKIIIPSVEHKQDIEKEMFELEQELDIPSSMRWHNSKPKQETLEEARKRISKDFSNGSFRYGVYHGVLEGAKWQQEQDKKLYSESDMNEFAMYVLKHNVITPKEWFNKLKNK